jgi:hypothetical protein
VRGGAVGARRSACWRRGCVCAPGSAQSNKSEDETSFLASPREASAVLAQRMEQLLQAGNRPRDLADAFQTAALEPSASPHATVAVLPALLRLGGPSSGDSFSLAEQTRGWMC